MFATFGSLGACVGEDFSFAVLLFPQTFFGSASFFALWWQLLFRVCLFSLFVFVFQGSSFSPLHCWYAAQYLHCWYAARGAVPSVFALASVVAGCVLSQCGVLALWGSRSMGGFDG